MCNIKAYGNARAWAALGDAHGAKVGGWTELEHDAAMVASLHAAHAGSASGPLRKSRGMRGHMHFRCAQSEKTDMSKGKGKGKGQFGFGPLSVSMDRLERAVDKISGRLSAKIV